MSETVLRFVGWCLLADLGAVLALTGLVAAVGRRGNVKVPFAALVSLALFGAGCLGLIYLAVWLLVKLL